MRSELKLRLHQSKHISIPFDLATDPTLPNLYLILFPLYLDLPRRIFKFDSIVVSLDGDV